MLPPVRARALPVVCAAAWMLACAPAAHGETLALDCRETRQEIRGFGTALNHWKPEIAALYRSPGFAERYVRELGATLVRIPLHPAVLPAPVEAVEDIDWHDYRDRDRFVAPVLDFAAAVHRVAPGEVRVVASVWSPPAWMKTNGDTRGGSLRPDRVRHFARYLAEWVRLLDERYGIPLYALSLQNEPHFAQSFESCVYTAENYRTTLRAVGDALRREGLAVRLMGPEDMSHATRRLERFADVVLRDPVAGPLLRVLAVHGVGRGLAPERADADFAALRDRAREGGRELWVTESSGESPRWPEQGDAPPLDELALGLHRALTRGDASAWLYWQITAAPGWGRFSLLEGAESTPKYDVVRHWARFVRPGARRLEAPPAVEGLDVSAFHRDADGATSVVVLNRGTGPRTLELSLVCPAGVPDVLHGVRTSAREHFAHAGDVPVRAGRARLEVPARSLVTLYGEARSRP